MLTRSNAPLIRFPRNIVGGFDVISGSIDYINAKGEIEVRAHGGIYQFSPRELCSIVQFFN